MNCEILRKKKMSRGDETEGRGNRWRILFYWFSIDKGDKCQQLG